MAYVEIVFMVVKTINLDIPQSTRTPPKDFGRPSILIWPSDLIPIQEQVFSEGLDNEKTAKKIHQILSENYPRYFVYLN